MIPHMLLLLPTIVVFVYCIIQLERKGERKQMLIVSVSMVCATLVIYAFHTVLLKEVPEIPFAEFLVNAITLSLIPCMYIYVSHYLGLPFQDRFFFTTLMLTILCLPYLVCLLLYPISEYMPTAWGGNMLTLSFDGKHPFTMSITALVVMLQTVTVCYKNILLNKIVSQRHLNMSLWIKFVMGMIVITTLVLNIVMLTPREQLVTTVGTWGMMILFAVISCTWLLVTSKISTNLLYFTDENENEVSISTSSIASLVSGLRYLMDKEKMFLQHSIKAEQVARKLGTNRTYLARAIRSEYNKTFPQLIIALRIEESKRMLLNNPDMRVGEIATQCGFKNSSVFGKTFKEETGVTPMDWRKHPDSKPAKKKKKEEEEKPAQEKQPIEEESI